jgi:hypothetical protein
MQTIESGAGPVHIVSTATDATELYRWLKARKSQPLGIDCETNGENPFSSAFRLRLVQMSDGIEAWVIRAEQPGMIDVVRDLVRMHPYWLAHYAEVDIRFLQRGAPGSVRIDQIHPHIACTQVVLAWFEPRTVTSADKPGIDIRIRLPRGLKDTAVRLLHTDVLDKAETALHIRFLELSAKEGADQAAPKVVWDHLDLLIRLGISATGAGVAIGRAFAALGVSSAKKTKKGKDCWNKESLVEIASRAHSPSSELSNLLTGLALTSLSLDSDNKSAELATALLALRQMNSDCSRSIEDRKTYGFAHIPDDDPIYWAYSGLDAMMTVRLWHLMTKEIKRRGQWPGLVDDLKLQWHIDLFTLKGKLVDGPYAKWLDAMYAEIIDCYAEELTTHGINKTAMGPAVGRAFNKLGVHSPKTTDSDAECWDKWVLKPIAEGKTEAPPVAVKLAQDIQLVRSATKFRAAYIQAMLDALTRDGRVHCSMRAIGTGTKRQSAERPALQQMPKRSDKRIRPAFRAEDGWVYVTCDVSQGEPRMMAARSGDRNLLRDLMAGDFYGALATLAFGDAYDPNNRKIPGSPSFQMRDGSKIGYLSRCYGGGDETLAAKLGTNLAFAKETRKRWDTEYHVLAAYERRLNRQPYVQLDSGWLAPLWDRYFVGPDGVPQLGSKPSRLGLNYDTQGSLADLVNRAVHKVIDAGWSWALRLIVHDELVCCVPESRAEECRQMLENAMTTTYRGVLFPCEATIEGRTWMPQTDTGFDTLELAELADANL